MKSIDLEYRENKSGGTKRKGVKEEGFHLMAMESQSHPNTMFRRT